MHPTAQSVTPFAIAKAAPLWASGDARRYIYMEHLKYLLTIALILLSACNNDWSRQLPNGYSVTSTHSGSIVVSEPNGRIIVGPSDYGAVIAVSSEFVLGNLDT